MYTLFSNIVMGYESKILRSLLYYDKGSRVLLPDKPEKFILGFFLWGNQKFWGVTG